MKNSRCQTKSLTNRSERISGLKDQIELGSSLTKNAKPKRSPGIKHPGNLACYEKFKPTNNRHRRMRRNTQQRH